MMYKLVLVAALIACASAGNHTAGNATTTGNVAVAAGTTTAAASTAGVAAPSKEKAKATLKGYRAGLKGAFDNFKKKKCAAAAGEAGEAGEAAGRNRRQGPDEELKTACAALRGYERWCEEARGRPCRTDERSSSLLDTCGQMCTTLKAATGTGMCALKGFAFGRAPQTGGTTADAAAEIAAMSCEQLKAAFEAHKEKAKAVYAKLKAARNNKKCEGANARLARESHAAANDADIAELSCSELETEIKTLKAQASAAGLELEASTDTTVGNTTVGTTTVAVPGSASRLAAGATAAAAVAVALLC